ncbi:hypothetical protein [Rubrivirga sp.]|uniref:hypothetical protein n=1 Tax=Rubrivirga sp. TaxID=1885344 RepID=UPI003B52D08C
MTETTEPRDEVIGDVRAVREAYAARFDYDVAALFRHARGRAERERDRPVVKREPKPVDAVAEAP